MEQDTFSENVQPSLRHLCLPGLDSDAVQAQLLVSFSALSLPDSWALGIFSRQYHVLRELQHRQEDATINPSGTATSFDLLVKKEQRQQLASRIFSGREETAG